MAKAKKGGKSLGAAEQGYVHLRVATEIVKPNPMNPRVIDGERFQQLVQSMKENPHVLKIRPIVVNKDMIALGGNQRLKAAKEAGLETVWIVNADDIDDQEQRSFIIADNVDFGKWDQDLLKSCGYEEAELKSLGVEEVDILGLGAESLGFEGGEPELPPEDLQEPDVDQSDLAKRYETYQNNSIKQVVLYYPDGIYEKVCQILDDVAKKLDCDDNSEVVLRLLNFWESYNEQECTDFDTEQGKGGPDQDDETS